MLGSVCEPNNCPWDKEGVLSRTMESAFPLSRLRNGWAMYEKFSPEIGRASNPDLPEILRGVGPLDGFNYGEDMVAFEIHVPKDAGEVRWEARRPSTMRSFS